MNMRVFSKVIYFVHTETLWEYLKPIHLVYVVADVKAEPKHHFQASGKLYPHKQTPQQNQEKPQLRLQTLLWWGGHSRTVSTWMPQIRWTTNKTDSRTHYSSQLSIFHGWITTKGNQVCHYGRNSQELLVHSNAEIYSHHHPVWSLFRHYLQDTSYDVWMFCYWTWPLEDFPAGLLVGSTCVKAWERQKAKSWSVLRECSKSD